MVFWTTYPIYQLCSSLCNQKRFLPQVFEKENIPSPTGKSCTILHGCHSPSLQEIRTYLRTYFGTPPNKPILDIPEQDLLGSKDHVLYVRDDSCNIVGSLRYHYIGEYQQEQIYIVDCFCIHPSWRGKGVGDYLLTQLHLYANQRNIPYALFLKEGVPLPILPSPLYTGVYVYRALTRQYQSSHCTILSIPLAYQLLDVYMKLNPDLCIIRNPTLANQRWILYRKSSDSILACVQDTFQQKEEKKMGWITAWLESPLITDEIRGIASDEITDCMYPMFDYVWMNQKWVGDSVRWTADGMFHWYSYQWTTSLKIDRSYCMLH